VNRNVVIALVAGLAAGLAIGWSVGSSVSRPSGPVVAAPVAMPIPNPAAGMSAGMGQMPATALDQRIAMHEDLVKQDPKNVQAWIQLGNDYFDSHQHQKSIDAYGKALALKPDDPDVLTDQGIMYRELKNFEQAAKNFQRANQVDPRHLQSLFNLGVVYAYDLRQTDKAVEAWTRVIQVDPNSTQAINARTALAQIQAGAAPPRP
jgi:tetratricopeptide (TPR) repeat protein